MTFARTTNTHNGSNCLSRIYANRRWRSRANGTSEPVEYYDGVEQATDAAGIE